ncbi:hypothetical protein A5745_08755 [Mycobacterium sp. IS-2888]|uniref:Nif11 family protein n=1 Tax=unclassified Mycobacterium TaxID=2642494 RepID=UPI00096EDF08|nr:MULTISPECIES: Nif11 family protein [unclassified Mycobacterium]OMC44352.1 hypothetical protein A5744_12235 [Mycobacterium sp. IS-1264]OMC48464.1 hypothetical protein A5745_08755 [Mycobacterium sp. IS-2888]
MSEYSLEQFFQALASDAALRERVVQAEQEADRRMRRESDAIAAIAAQAGFDLSEWAKRPSDGKPEPSGHQTHCSLTCCAVGTSSFW